MVDKNRSKVVILRKRLSHAGRLFHLRLHADKKVFSDINPTVTQKQFKTVPTLRRNVKNLLESILIRPKQFYTLKVNPDVNA